MPKPIINIADVALEPWPAGAALSGEASARYEADNTGVRSQFPLMSCDWAIQIRLDPC